MGRLGVACRPQFISQPVMLWEAQGQIGKGKRKERKLQNWKKPIDPQLPQCREAHGDMDAVPMFIEPSHAELGLESRFTTLGLGCLCTILCGFSFVED